MNASNIFFSWFLTATVGSFCFTILQLILGDLSFHMLELIIVFSISWLLSMLFYTPAIIVLMVVHSQNENGNKPLYQQFSALKNAHLYTFFFILLAGYLWILLRAWMFMALILDYTLTVGLYGIVALVVWRIRFRKVREEIAGLREND